MYVDLCDYLLPPVSLKFHEGRPGWFCACSPWHLPWHLASWALSKCVSRHSATEGGPRPGLSGAASATRDRNGVLKTQKKERRVGRGSEWFTEEGIFELDFEGCVGVFHGMEVDVKCVGIGILGRRNNMSEGTEV